jgi:hypothetical protein
MGQVGKNQGPGGQEIWLTESQVFDPVAYGKAQNILGKIPLIGKFLGGDMRRPEESVNYGGLGSSNVSIRAADKKSAAGSGMVYSGSQSRKKKEYVPTDARGLPTGARGLGTMTTNHQGPGSFSQKGGMFTYSSTFGGGGRGMHGYFSEDTGMQGRTTGEMQGPMMMLKEFQGSDRGSHGYLPSIPRYSIAETRKGQAKFALENFKALNKHAAKKFLEPGFEQMMKRKAKDFSGSRKVTRKFL